MRQFVQVHELDRGYLVRNTFAVAPACGADQRLPARARELKRLSLRRQFPQLGDLQLERSWGGMIAFVRYANGFFGEHLCSVQARNFAFVRFTVSSCRNWLLVATARH